MTEDLSFTVDYQGHPLCFEPIRHSDGQLQGYMYRCPNGAHRTFNWIDTESGKRHTLTRAIDGRVTIRGSLLCSQGCGWHVFITESVARDA